MASQGQRERPGWVNTAQFETFLKASLAHHEATKAVVGSMAELTAQNVPLDVLNPFFHMNATQMAEVRPGIVAANQGTGLAESWNRFLGDRMTEADTRNGLETAFVKLLAAMKVEWRVEDPYHALIEELFDVSTSREIRRRIEYEQYRIQHDLIRQLHQNMQDQPPQELR